VKTTAESATNSYLHLLQVVGDLIRWQEWYDSKVPLFFVCFYYLCLIEPPPNNQVLTKFAIVTGFACLYLAFGYYINDFSDRECDSHAGKQKLITHLPGPVVVGSLCILGLAGMAIPFTQIRDYPLAMWLAGVAYFFAVFYSMPPIRFKERGVWGLMVSATAQRSLPVLLVFAIFNHFALDTWLFFSLFCLIGVRWILVHQLIDFKNDLNAGTCTFATELGYRRTEYVLCGLIFPLEVISLAVLWEWLISRIPGLGILPVGYLIIVIINWVLWKGIGRPYTFTAYGRLPLSDFYYAYWPLALVTALALRQPAFWPILGFNVLWQGSYLLRKGKTALHLGRAKLGFVGQRGTH
jgi:4-hydroxybenzoate polyprenyltransferase